MYKITNIGSLGTDYTVADQHGNIINTIQIIPAEEITDAALGEYTDAFGGYASYLEKSISVLEGHDDIDPNSILWYSTTEDEVVLSDIIEFAVKNGYTKIILEHLDPIDD